jgi:hypothetical protein
MELQVTNSIELTSASPMLIIFTSRSSRAMPNFFKYERQELAESGFTVRSSTIEYIVSHFTDPTPPSFDLLEDLGSSAYKTFAL